jgi:ADP-ribose pyrophosphatase YjhB (NUDIX family)/HD superfamily phosphodiesterase
VKSKVRSKLVLKIVNLCVSDKEKKNFLFIHRTKSPFLGYFGMMGGKVEDGESFDAAASRELFEESGINANGKFLGVCNEKIIENDNVLKELDIYFFHFIIDRGTKFNSSDEGEIRWISNDEFHCENLIPSDPLMIKTFFDSPGCRVVSIIEKNGEEYIQKNFQKQEDIVEKVRGFVREICDNLEHGDEWYNNHFSTVVKYSKILSEKLNCDKEIVEIAAWLHDLGSVTIGREDHHITGCQIAEKKLKELNYNPDKIEKVKHCILTHRGSKNIKRETIEAEILADADSMSHFDEIGGLFKYEFIINGITFKQKEAQKRVKDKLTRSYNKLSDSAKKIIKPKYDAAILLLGDNPVGLNDKKVGAGVGVMIINKGKVLLGKRHEDNFVSNSVLGGEGSWTFPGGKIEYGESFEEAGIRETKEECNLDLNKIEVICVNNDSNEKAQFVTIGLFSDDVSGEVKVMEEDKITEWRWFLLDSLPEEIYSPTLKMINNYKNKIFYIGGKN